MTAEAAEFGRLGVVEMVGDEAEEESVGFVSGGGEVALIEVLPVEGGGGDGAEFDEGEVGCFLMEE